MSPAAGARAVDAALARLARLVESARPELGALAGAADAPVALADWLYAHWYTAPAPRWRAPPVTGARDILVPQLRAALAAAGRWEPGWVALRPLGRDRWLAARGALVRALAPGDYANWARPGVPPAPGDGLAVLDRLEWVDPATGFWAARSLAAEPAAPLKRLYCSVGAGAAAAVLHALIPVLDASGCPWSLKCPAEAAGFARADSMVVYLARGDWPVVEPRLLALLPRLRRELRSAVPPLTLPIGRGAAVADNPALDGQSFGQSRCAALVAGVRALLAAPAAPAAALGVLKQSLREHGIDPGRPWECC
jgi:hypothetical protein